MLDHPGPMKASFQNFNIKLCCIFPRCTITLGVDADTAVVALNSTINVGIMGGNNTSNIALNYDMVHLVESMVLRI